MSKNPKAVKNLTMTAIFAALSTILMFLDVSVPFMPSFLKFDLSDMPAMLAAYTVGPISGVTVALIKNLINLTTTMTGGVGELSNFILTALLVLPAGIIYRYRRTFKGAVAGALLGLFCMSGMSLLTNYFIVYPVYQKLMPMEAILGAYRAINPKVETLWDALIWFNLPFTFAKGFMSTLIVFLVYKKISNFIKKF